MRPTTAVNDNDFDFQALLHLGTVFEHPKDVVSHPNQGLKAPVSIQSILEALCELDGHPRNPPGGKPNRPLSHRESWPPEEYKSRAQCSKLT